MTCHLCYNISDPLPPQPPIISLHAKTDRRNIAQTHRLHLSVKSSILNTAGSDGLGRSLEWTRTMCKKEARAVQNNLETNCDGRAKRDVLAWCEAQHAAEDRSRWKQTVDALCPTGRKMTKRILNTTHLGSLEAFSFWRPTHWYPVPWDLPRSESWKLASQPWKVKTFVKA